MANQQRSPLTPISVNAYLGPAFNACIETQDLQLQELNPGLLRYTRTGNENILPGTNYYSSQQNQLRKAAPQAVGTVCSPMIVSPWSPEPVAACRSNLTSPETLDSLLSFSPPSSLSAFSTSLQKIAPRFKLSTYSHAQLEEDVLVMDGVVINNSSKSFVTPEACRKQKSSGSNSSSSGSSTGASAKCLYKTEICRSWEDSGNCRYGIKCQFAHGKDELRRAIRHPKYKTEICRAFTVTGTCPYGARCRFIHPQSDQTNDYGEDFNFPAILDAILDEILDLSPADFDEIRSNAFPSRSSRRRLPVFQQICPVSPDSAN